jgi:hypothetical protein
MLLDRKTNAHIYWERPVRNDSIILIPYIVDSIAINVGNEFAVDNGVERFCEVKITSNHNHNCKALCPPIHNRPADITQFVKLQNQSTRSQEYQHVLKTSVHFRLKTVWQAVPDCKTGIAESPLAEPSFQCRLAIQRMTVRPEAGSQGTVCGKVDHINHVVRTLIGVGEMHQEA